jgi:WhiB family transcriptional regulator, redox-sensing transcriptional regulator
MSATIPGITIPGPPIVGAATELVRVDVDWWHRAACRHEDPELFFPVGTTGPALDQLAEAKTVCHRCPVAADCLAWALDTGQRHGVWGGLGEDERHELQQLGHRTSGRTTLVMISVSVRKNGFLEVGRPGRGPAR